jgi:hypothetical protein
LLKALQQALGPKSRLSRQDFVEIFQILEKKLCGKAIFGLLGRKRSRYLIQSHSLLPTIGVDAYFSHSVTYFHVELRHPTGFSFRSHFENHSSKAAIGPR